MKSKIYITAIFCMFLFVGKTYAQADYVIKDTTYTTSPNSIGLKSYYANVEDAEGACSNVGKHFRIRGSKDGGYVEFTVPNAENVTFVLKGKSSSKDRNINIFRNSELVRSVAGLDADNCATFSENIHSNVPVTYKITGGDVSSTKPVVLKSIVVEKYVESSGIDVLQSKQLKIYPNPVQNTLQIQLPDDVKANNVTIYNSVGQLVLSQRVNEETILDLSVGHLSSGFYNLLIQTEQGRISSKFIKK